jgi:hypothetical protein
MKMRSTTEAVADFDIPYYIRGLALGIPAILLGLQISGWIFFIPVITHGHFDFRQLYTAGYMVRSGHGHELYDYGAQKRFQDLVVSREQIALPFNHPAYEALLFVPFSMLWYRTAYFVFLSMDLVLLFVCFRSLRPRMDRLARIWPPLPAAMLLTFLPVGAALMQGQDSIVLLTLLSAAAAWLGEGCEFTAGVLVGLGLFKFQIVIPIATLFLLLRRWRFSSGFVTSAATVSCLSVWLVGRAQTKVYVQSLASMSVALASPLDQFRYGIVPASMPNIRGLVASLAATHLPNAYTQAVTLLASGILFLVTAIFVRKQHDPDVFAVAILLSTLVSYHLLMHDLSVLLIPITTTVNGCIAEVRGNRAARVTVCAATLVFVAPACMSFFPDHFFLVSLPLCAFLFTLLWQSRHRSELSQKSVMTSF